MPETNLGLPERPAQPPDLRPQVDHDDQEPAGAAADVDDAVGAVADQDGVAAGEGHRLLIVHGDFEGAGDDVDEELAVVEDLARGLLAAGDLDRPPGLVIADPG